MYDNRIKLLTIFGVVSIIILFVIQVYWVKQAYNISESQFDVSVKAALLSVAEKITRENNTALTKPNPIKKINPRLYLAELNTPIDPSKLDVDLRNAFEYYNLKHDIEYNIYNCQSDEVVYCDYIKTERAPVEKFPDQIPVFEGMDHYFSVSFPHHPILTLNNIPMWVVTSFVLMIVVVFILFAFYVIFSQKLVTQSQRDFINNMTHEFKTPITTISIIQQELQKPNMVQSPERLKKYTDIIGTEISKLNDHVNQILQISTLEKSEITLNKEVCSAHLMLEECKSSSEILGLEKNITIRSKHLAKNDAIIADTSHFKNIINNLIENAIKYSEENTDIILESQNKNNLLLIKVIDKGKGIPKADLKRIFDKFYRINNDKIHDNKGFGLGLYYVKKIVQAHKWKIRAESKLGEGTTIILSVPNHTN